MKAIIFFKNDPAFGSHSKIYTSELPFEKFDSKSEREFVRTDVKKLYNSLSSSTLTWIKFEDEMNGLTMDE